MYLRDFNIRRFRKIAHDETKIWGRFVKFLIERRLLRDVEHERQRLSLTKMLEQANKAWRGVKVFQPDWGDGSHCVVLGVELKAKGLRFHFILNAYSEPLEYELPNLASDD